MKTRFLLYMLYAVIALSCNTPQGYELQGTFQGAPDSTVVYLGADSTYIMNNNFTFKGVVTHPQLVELKVPAINEYGFPGFKGTRIWLENCPINVSCLWDSLTHVYGYSPHLNLTGSALNSTYQNYLAEIHSIPSYNKQWEEYIMIYLMPSMQGGEVNIERGKELIREINALKDQKQQTAVNFVREHPMSPISVELLIELLNGQSFTVDEAEALMQGLDSSLLLLPAYEQLQEQFKFFSPTAKGAKYTDLTLTTLDGKIVNLSDYIEPGKYTMLEFWASWCKPCRAEIPHLRHVVANYNKRFKLISISLDENSKEWQKAVNSEKMSWTQLNDAKSWKGQAVKAYRISGVPYSLLLDEQGNIIAGELRGAELDVVLDSIFTSEKKETY